MNRTIKDSDQLAEIDYKVFCNNLAKHLDGRILASDNGITFRDQEKPRLPGRYSVGPDSADQYPSRRVHWFDKPEKAFDFFLSETSKD